MLRITRATHRLSGARSRTGSVLLAALIAIAWSPTISSASVEVSVNPPSRPAPGGDFSFTFSISTSGTISDLTDSVYGDLGDPGNPVPSDNTCDELIGVSGSDTCSFTGSFTGIAGASQTNTVSMFDIDEEGNPGIQSGESTVTLTPAEPPPDPDAPPHSDFNGDGLVDVAVGAPGEDVGAIVDGGVAHVIYGTGIGLSSTASQLWSQDSAGIADSVEDGDGFGATLSTGDFNADGFDDLAIGVPGEDVGTIGDGGAVNVIYGSASGLTSAGSQLWSQASLEIADNAESGDRFGSVLAAGNLDADGFAELVVGVPDESVAAYAGAGIAHVIRGGAEGLTATGSALWGQNSSGIADIAEAGDGFGASLAIGDLNGATRQDLAIGAPGENVGSIVDGGVIHAIYGSASGLTSAGNQRWSQNSTGIAESTESGDGFGSVLAIGRLNDDAMADLVVGVPSESVAAYAGAGIAHVIRGGAQGLTATGSTLWGQNSSGIADIAEAGDGFGASLAIGALNGAVGGELAIGAPGEDVGSIVDGGVVHAIYGSASGPKSSGSQLWSQNSTGMADSTESGDRFGSALAIANFGEDTIAELVVGVPLESVAAYGAAGIAHVIPGTADGLTATGSQLWGQNSSGIADIAEVGDGFAAALGT